MESPKNKNSSEYLKMKVMTASPEELQLMLYDGAIRFCEQARLAIQNSEIESSYTLLSRAQKILLEMYVSMREEYAPDICANMRRLYMYSYDCLVEANLRKSVEKVDEALKVIRHLRDSWVLVIEKLQAERAGQISGEAASSETARADSVGQRVPAAVGLEAEVGAMFSIEG